MTPADEFASGIVEKVFGARKDTDVETNSPDHILTSRDMLRKFASLCFDSGQLHTMRIAKTGFETMAEIALGGKKESI